MTLVWRKSQNLGTLSFMNTSKSPSQSRENDHILAAADDDFSAFTLQMADKTDISMPTRVMNIADFTASAQLKAARERAREIGVTLASTSIEQLPSSPKALLRFAGGVHVLTKSVFVIGRGKDIADLFIDDDRVSREHVAVIFAGGEFFVEDLESTNGTFVNGERTKRARLNPGEQLRVGSHEFSLAWED